MITESKKDLPQWNSVARSLLTVMQVGAAGFVPSRVKCSSHVHSAFLCIAVTLYPWKILLVVLDRSYGTYSTVTPLSKEKCLISNENVSCTPFEHTILYNLGKRKDFCVEMKRMFFHPKHK